MTRRERRRYDMLTRVRAFGATHAQLFPATSTAHDAFVTLAAEVDRLAALDVAERAAAQASRVGRKAAARAVLADALTRAGFTARVLAKTTPQLQARVELPLPREDQALLTAARQFVASAAPYAAWFAAHGLPVQQLEAHIAAFEQALHERGRGRDDRVKTRAEIHAAFARAMDAVETLDVSVANYLTADPVARAVWTHDRRVEPRRRSSQHGEPSATPADAPTEEAVPVEQAVAA